MFNVFNEQNYEISEEEATGSVQLTATTSADVTRCTGDIVVYTRKKEDMERNLDEMRRVMVKWGVSVHRGEM